MGRQTYFYCFKPARLLHLVVDDGLVLADAFVSGSREDHILDEDMRSTHHKVHQKWHACNGLAISSMSKH